MRAEPTNSPTICGFAGSAREGSLNRRLLHSVADLCTASGHDVRLIEPADLALPLFNQDLEDSQGIPAGVASIQSAIAGSDAVLIASPEYNGGYTPLFKNTIDWISRIDHLTFFPKYVGLLCATPGRRGGARALAQMEQLFANIFVSTHAPSFGIGDARAALEQKPVPGLRDWVQGFLSGAAAHAAIPPAHPDR